MSPGEGLPIFPTSPSGEQPDCPSLRASDEHCFIVRVLRARRMSGCSPSFLLRPRVARAQGTHRAIPPLLADFFSIMLGRRGYYHATDARSSRWVEALQSDDKDFLPIAPKANQLIFVRWSFESMLPLQAIRINIRADCAEEVRPLLPLYAGPPSSMSCG